MGKWEMVRLGDVFNLQMGKTPSRDDQKYWNNGDHKWISIADISNASKYISHTKETISQTAVCESGIRQVPKDTVIMSFKLSVGKVAITSKAMYTNEAIMAFCPKGSNDFHIGFLYYALLYTDWSEGSNKAVKGITLNKATLALRTIPLPPLPVQRKIADVLDRASALIEKRKVQIEKLDLLVKSRFIEMFGDPVTNPMGWSTSTLGELGDFKNGINFRSSDRGYRITCLGVGDFKNHEKIENFELLPTVFLNEALSEDYMLQSGDIVFVRSNGNQALVGRNLIVYPNGTKATFSGFCIRFRKNNAAVNETYLNHVLRIPSAKSRLLSDGRGCNIKNLNQQMLSAQNIPLPPLDQQTFFATFASRVESQKTLLQQSLTKLEQGYKSLMQKCFSGELF